MKKLLAYILPVFLLSSFLLFSKTNKEEVEATGNRPTYNIPVLSGEELDYSNQVFDDFDNGIDSSRWYIYNKTWGQVNGRQNGGVVPDNVFYDSSEGTAILRTTGDQYADKLITPGPNAQTEGGRRTGADLVSKFWTYPGRYEVRMRVAPRYGACTSLWTYIEYDSFYNGDRNNHEIDIELPWHGDFNQISYGNYSALNKHTSYKYHTTSPMNDGEYHTFGFDWYYNENTNHKQINYYYDGNVYTINSNIPFYKTKVNIGVWIPDSDLAGKIPAFDTAYLDIDYFKYIPFKNNLHQDSDYANAYNINSSHYSNTYPTLSTPFPISERNYFPNGKFNFVNKRSSSDWLNESITGLANSGAEVLKKTYDYANSSTSGGIKLNENGTLSATIDSCYEQQKYELKFNYKYGGTAKIEYYSADGVLLDTSNYELNYLSSWTEFDEIVSMFENVSYIKVKFIGGSETLILDNIFLTFKGVGELIENENTNHFMTGFYGNTSALDTFSTAKNTTSSKVTDAVINDADPTSTIDWKLSVAKYEYKSGKDFVGSITMGSGSNTISDSEDATYSGIYNAVNANETLSGKQSVIYSTNSITNLKDISLAWGSCEAGAVYIVYKIKGENTWKYLGTSFEGTNKNAGTNDSNSWNRRQLVLNSSNNNFNEKLLGKTAQIGFMFSSNDSNADKSYIRINFIMINKVKSIKAKIDYWSKNNTNLCGVSGLLDDSTSLEYGDLYFTNYNLLVDEANEMNVAIERNGSALEATYFDEFEYLCGIANVSLNDVPSQRQLTNLRSDKKQIYMVLIAVILSTSTLTSLVFMKIHKRKGGLH